MSKLRSRHRSRRRPTIGCTPRVRSSSTTDAVGGGAEHEVADVAVAASRAHRHAHASYVVGERQRGQTCSELRAHLVSRRRGVGPGEVEVDDRVLARRAVGDVRRHRGDELGALGRARPPCRSRTPAGSVARPASSSPPRHGRGAPDPRATARRAGRTRGSDVERAPPASARGRERLLEPLGTGSDVCSGIAASASMRRARSGMSPSAASAASSSRTPSRMSDRSASTAGWSNQRKRTLRARSPTHRVARLGDATEALQQRARTDSQLTDRRGLATPAAEHGGGERDLGGRALLGQEDAEDRGLQLGGALQVSTP